MRLFSRAWIGTAALLGLLGSQMVPSIGNAAVTCVYNAAAHRVEIAADFEGVEVIRSGLEIWVGAAPCTDGVVSATVSNTDLIKFEAVSSDLSIDLIGGPLAPGFSNEPGTSDEIEISVTGARTTIIGTPGADHIVVGREGINLNAGEPSDDIDVLNLRTDFTSGLDGGGGNDILSNRGGSGTGGPVDAPMGFHGGSGNDVLLASQVMGEDAIDFFPSNFMRGGLGNDRLEGGPFGDDMDGEGGADVLVGGGEESWGDVMEGGDGVDTVSFASSKEAIDVHLATDNVDPSDSTVPGIENVIGSRYGDTIIGDGSENSLRGGGGNDVLQGDSGIDNMLGEGGNDLLDGGSSGNELLNGGPGSDTAEYLVALTSVNLQAGTATIGGTSDTLTSIENASVPGGTSVVGSAGPNVIQIFSLSSGAEISAGGGNDRIIGRDGDDTFLGGDGNDYIERRDGDGSVIGGAGNDEIVVRFGDQTISGGPGRDLMDFSSTLTSLTLDLRVTAAQSTGFGNKTISGIEDVVGAQGSDDITGTNGANRLDGFTGDDVVMGMGGNDSLSVDQGEDDLFGGSGRDTLTFAAASAGARADLAITGVQDTGYGFDTLRQFENVVGSAFADILKGDNAANVLSGGAGNDQLVGRGGNDTLNGGPGSDSCDGGPGVDKLLSC